MDDSDDFSITKELTAPGEELAAAVAEHLASPDTDKLARALTKYRQARLWS